MKTILIENDREIVKNISCCLMLRWPQCTVLSSPDGTKAIQFIESEHPDLVILDIDSAQKTNLQLLHKIRSVSDVPLIVMSEKATDMEKLSALEDGADDYVAKPLNALEFLLRVVALLRRARGDGFTKTKELEFTIGELTLNDETHEVLVSGNCTKLTPIEYNMLWLLAKNAGKVITHTQLMEKVWGSDYTDDRSFIKKYIYRLRSKLHDDARNPKIIISERGVGYKLANNH